MQYCAKLYMQEGNRGVNTKAENKQIAVVVVGMNLQKSWLG